MLTLKYVHKGKSNAYLEYINQFRTVRGEKKKSPEETRRKWKQKRKEIIIYAMSHKSFTVVKKHKTKDYF